MIFSGDTAWGGDFKRPATQLGCVIFSGPRHSSGAEYSAGRHKFGYVSPVYRRVVAMENAASDITRSVINHCPVFADRNKEAFP